MRSKLGGGVGGVKSGQMFLANSASEVHIIPSWSCQQAAGSRQWDWSSQTMELERPDGLRSFSRVTEMDPPPAPRFSSCS